MLSGGRDSFLSACRLLENKCKYKIKMVTYDNGCSYGSSNAKTVAKRLIDQYGDSRAEYLGVYKISGVIREFFSPYFNMKPEDLQREFFGLTASQFHCLICRTSMYIYSIWLCKLLGIHFIAEGGRKDQQFVIELPGMEKDRYPALVKMAGLELLLPVYELDSNWERDNELLRRKFISKSYEPKCLIGFPIENSVDDSVIRGVHAYYDKVILPIIKSKGMLDDDSYLQYLKNEYDELQP